MNVTESELDTRPNIVFILADDLGWRDLGCYGSSFYETPVLDQLGRDGALFTDAYAAAPVCSPTRASIMSGKYPASVGVTQFIGGHGVGALTDVPYFTCLPTQEFSLGRAMREGGYSTWHVGKWHLGPRRTWPDQHGFDINLGGCEWGHPKSYFSPYGCPTLEDGPDDEYLTDRLTDEAINLIEGSGDRPFFLNLWQYAVHIPIQVPAELEEKYKAKAADLGLDQEDPFELGDHVPVWHNRHGRIVRRRVQSDPAYAAMIENLDTNVGRLLEALEACGKRENTLVIFTSDNGGLSTAQGSPTTNAPLADGKGWLSEGGIREPLIMNWPDVIKPGVRVSEPVTSPDFYPTIMAAAGLPTPFQQEIEGINILPAATGNAVDRSEPIYWHYPHYSNQGGTPACGLRSGEWKIVRDFETGKVRLYNVASDPGETADLALERPDVADDLESLLDEWLQTSRALTPRRNPQPKPYEGLAGYFIGSEIVEAPRY